MNDLSNELIENKKNISSLHIILIIILLTVDYYSIFRYGIELKSIKYIINYQELLVINTTILAVGSLLFLLSEKIPIQFFVILFFISGIYFFNLSSDFDEFINKSISETLIFTIVLFILISGSKKIYLFIIGFLEIFKNLTVIGIMIFFCLISTFLLYQHYENLNNNWESISIKENNYSFKKYSLLETLFRQKIFSTNKLEVLQTNINFQNSELYIEKLKEFGILTDNTLKYNDDKLYSNYISNEDYKTFFIVKKAENSSIKNIKMFIIFSKKDKDKEEYQINNIQEKELKIIDNE